MTFATESPFGRFLLIDFVGNIFMKIRVIVPYEVKIVTFAFLVEKRFYPLDSLWRPGV